MSTRSRVTRLSQEDLELRRVEVLEKLGKSEHLLALKVESSEPLTDLEWAVMTELNDIDYLLGQWETNAEDAAYERLAEARRSTVAIRKSIARRRTVRQ